MDEPATTTASVSEPNEDLASAGLIKRLYRWVLSWSESPYGSWMLMVIAFAESSFFLIPPDVLLMPLALGKPQKAYRFALQCTVASALGGLLGYALGYFLFAEICEPILAFYHLEDTRIAVTKLYKDYNALIVFVAGFTPIPYKLFTILGGLCEVNIAVFFIASFLSRGSRFFLLAWICKRFGRQSEAFVETYHKRIVWISTAIVALAVIAWIVYRMMTN